jgi:hypothetical protein
MPGTFKNLLLFSISFLCALFVQAQQDSLLISNDTIKSMGKPIQTMANPTMPYSPRKAIIRSAMIPGWGQIYNKKYWKLPLVYGALGTTTYLFFRNLNQYKEAKSAYILATDGDPTNDNQIKQPYFSVKDQPERIRTFRNQVRQNVDYSVLFFLIFWGLNVVDAAVDAHLKTFDVSNDLSLQIKPGFSPLAKTNGISLIMPLGKK